MTIEKARNLVVGQTISFKLDDTHELWLKVEKVQLLNGKGVKIWASNKKYDATIDAGALHGIRIVSAARLAAVSASMAKMLYSTGGTYAKGNKNKTARRPNIPGSEE